MSHRQTAPIVPHRGLLLGFGAVAGSGWLLDALVLTCLVHLARIQAGWANVASAMTAAAFVYAVSHIWVHGGPRGAYRGPLMAYLLYTIVLITIMSYFLDLIFRGLAEWIGTTAALVAAKILVTPPQFYLNYIVSRHLAMRAGGSSP